MDYWPNVGIMLLTYEDGERDTAQRTLRAALDGIHYSGELSVHIADDGSVPGHVDALREIAGGYSNIHTVGHTDAARRGYGASFNLATQKMHPACEAILVLEDDWVLTRALDLDPLVETIVEGGPGIECVRLGYLGFTQALTGTVVNTRAGKMILLDATSPERHVAAGHPRLERTAWERRVGPWTEGLAPGATEFDWCGRDEARWGVAWPLDLGPASMNNDSLFVHIGGHGLGEVEPEA